MEHDVYFGKHSEPPSYHWARCYRCKQEHRRGYADYLAPMPGECPGPPAPQPVEE